LEDLIQNLLPYIESSKLNIICCKSFQKYGTLGFAKVMAGCHLVINNGAEHFNSINECLAECENSLKIHNWDEIQLLAHILSYAPEQELQFIKRAAGNGKMATHCKYYRKR
jgi:hypothetical protein